MRLLLLSILGNGALDPDPCDRMSPEDMIHITDTVLTIICFADLKCSALLVCLEPIKLIKGKV